MPTKPTRIPAAPPAPKATLAAAPSPAPVPQAAPALQPQPEAVKPVKRVSVRTRYAYPIWVAYAGQYVRPGETVELDEVRWLRRQIEQRTFIEV